MGTCEGHSGPSASREEQQSLLGEKETGLMASETGYPSENVCENGKNKTIKTMAGMLMAGAFKAGSPFPSSV